MATKILVPLKKHDRLEEIVPYIEEVAEPGASVVFLIRHPVSGFKWLQAYAAISQCGIETALAIRRMAESYSRRMRMQLARQKVFSACEALHRLGVTVTVDIYAGSLSKTLSSLVSHEDLQFVVMRPGLDSESRAICKGWFQLEAYSGIRFRH
jgi:hypothetical protein